MKYRTVLYPPPELGSDRRPRQAFHRTLVNARSWAKFVLEKEHSDLTLSEWEKLAPESRPRVKVFEVVERLVEEVGLDASSEKKV